MADKKDQLTDSEITELLPRFETQARLFSDAVRGLQTYLQIRRLMPALEKNRADLYEKIKTADEELKQHKENITTAKARLDQDLEAHRERIAQAVESEREKAADRVIELKKTISQCENESADAKRAYTAEIAHIERAVEKQKQQLVELEKMTEGKRSELHQLTEDLRALRARHGLDQPAA